MKIEFNKDCFACYDNPYKKSRIDFCRDKLSLLTWKDIDNTIAKKECIAVDDDERFYTWLFFIDLVDIDNDRIKLAWGSCAS